MSAVQHALVMRAVSGRALAASLWLLLAACDGGYPLAPTACDEWCRTSQRKRCPEDNPTTCVTQCERDRRTGDRCDEFLLAQIACYDRIPEGAFSCDPYTTYVRGQHCVREKYAFQTCAQPTATECFVFCENFFSRCEGQTLLSCSTGCYVDEGCLEPFEAFYRCLDQVGLACDAANLDLICQAEGDALNACRGRREE